MPKGTRVSRCVEKVKRRDGGVNPYAVCTKSTHQVYKTGKPTKGAKKK
jgi:hypothetical protein